MDIYFYFSWIIHLGIELLSHKLDLGEIMKSFFFFFLKYSMNLRFHQYSVGFTCSVSLSTLIIVRLLFFSHFGRLMVSHMSFILHFLNRNDVGILFTCFIGHLDVISCEVPVQFLPILPYSAF